MLESLWDRFGFGSAAGSAGERRREAHREPVAWPAMIEVGGRELPIEVGNISTSGLMADVDVELGAGTQVTVRLGDSVRLTGEVRWCREGRIGLRFDAPVELDAAVISRFRDACVEQAKTMSRWMV